MHKNTVFIVAIMTTLFCAGCQTPGPKRSQRAELGHNHQYKHSNDGLPDDLKRLDKVVNAKPKFEPKSSYGNPKSYTVKNKTYKVLSHNRDFNQKGLASWYGKKFHGYKTSNGEVYDMYGMSAAHKTLPIPSYIKIRNLENDSTAIVRVNDRGPFHGSDRIVDLSYAAAYKLGIVQKGTAKVEIIAINPGHKNPGKDPYIQPTPYKSTRFLQIGAFREQVNAEVLVNQLKGVISLPVRIIAHNKIHKVQLGPIRLKDDIDKIQQVLSDHNINIGILTN